MSTSKKDPRKSIPSHTRLHLWVKAGGRCQLKHCNKPVYRHEMTLADGNFADVAHIIGAKSGGPRGGGESEALQIDPANLMLLCKACHKLIDQYEKDYGAERLRQWKREHEERIEILTSFSPQIPRSTILRFQVNIGDRIIGIDDQTMYNAMFDREPPKYPVDKKGISIVEEHFDLYAEQAYWEKFAKDRIDKKLRFYLDRGISDEPVRHLSIFGIGPIPLLMYLGKSLGDTIQADIYHANRKITDTNKTWSWGKEPAGNLPAFRSECIVDIPDSKKVAVILALSDTVAEDKYTNFLEENFAIYKISVQEPSVHLIVSPKQMQDFSQLFRKLLNEIQDKHGKSCEVYLLPAVPACIAIESGRVLLPTKDPVIYACQFQPDGVFKRVLRVN